jgi:26S proteasome regulatory subunit N11
VIDPIQSVKGKVVIDAFRNISPQLLQQGIEPRQVTSVVGHLNRPSLQAVIHGLNRHYYSLPIGYRKNAHEAQMLMNVHKRKWTQGLSVASFPAARKSDEALLASISTKAGEYATRVNEEDGKTAAQIALDNVGKIDVKKRLEADCATLFADNIMQSLGTTLDTTIF